MKLYLVLGKILRAAAYSMDYQPAKVALRRCYLFGERVEEDRKEALQWLQELPDNGDIEAMYYVAFCYADPGTDERERALSILWAQKAAAKGDMNFLGKIFETG